MTNIAFIGAGVMGKPMALRLLQAGHRLYLPAHVRPLPPELIEAGGIAVDSPKQAAADAELIILMVPSTVQVEEVLFSANGIAGHLSAGKVVIDMSSISPLATKVFAQRVEETGAKYVDAPVSGGEVGAKAGTLSIMCGADEDVFQRVLPVLQSMGSRITLVGGNGAGQTAKVANQMIVAINIQAVAEALLFARKAGADPAKVREALLGGFASSRVLEVHGERMIRGTFDPGFRIRLHQKDLDLALTGAKEMSLSAPCTALVQQTLNACAALGGAEWDHSALVKALEAASGCCLRDE